MHNGFEEKKTAVSGSTISGLKAEDGGYQGHVFRDLKNYRIISLVVNSHQECNVAISSVLDCFKLMKD
jgi:hypothetical protein